MSELRLPLPADLLAAVIHEAQRDDCLVPDWIREAIQIRLASRAHPHERVARLPAQVCRRCSRPERLHARSLCRRCYFAVYQSGRQRPCGDCGRRRYLVAHGLCGACYNRGRRAAQRLLTRCCAACGAVLMGVNVQRLYCGDACRKRAARRRAAS